MDNNMKRKSNVGATKSNKKTKQETTEADDTCKYSVEEVDVILRPVTHQENSILGSLRTPRFSLIGHVWVLDGEIWLHPVYSG